MKVETVKKNYNWQASLPKNWNVTRIGDLIPITSSKRVFEEDWTTSGIPFYRAREVVLLNKNGYVENQLFITKEKYIDLKKISGIPKIGDILVTGVGTLGISYVIQNTEPFYFKDGNLIWLKVNKKINSKFLNYLFVSNIIKEQIINSAPGTTVGTYTINAAKKTEIPYPSLNEQEKIVNFLDIETSKIDRKISILEQKFDKLEDYKQSVIFETVTNGIDNSVAMKDSGIDWIGDIPAHWDVKRVKDIFTLKKGKNSGLYSADFIHDSVNKGTFPVYSGQTENNGIMGSINTFEYNYSQGILFTTTVGAKAMTVKRLFNEFSLSQNCGLLIPIKPINLDYSYYLISACFSFVKQSIPSHMQPSLRKEDLSSFYCLDIPLKEQEKIVSYLNEIVSKIDYKKSIIKKQIELLKEYKQSVIFEAVTGKLEIQ